MIDLLAAVVGSNAVIVLCIAFAKLYREARERLQARVRDELTEQLLPILEGEAQPLELPSPQSISGAAALDTLLGLIATLKGEAHDRLVAVLEDNGYIGHIVRRSRDRRTRERAKGAALLGGAHSVRGVPRLTALLKDDPSATVRMLAAEALGAIGHAPSVHTLLDAARDPARYNEARIANALATMGSIALPALQNALADNDTRIVSLALDILIDIGTVGEAERVADLLAHRSPEVRARAACLLGTAGIVESIPVLVFASRDPIWFVRLRIVKALASIGVPHDDQERGGYFAALHHMLYDDHWHVRRHAAAALAAAGSQGCAILRDVATDVARAALRFHELHRGRHVSTVF